MPGERLTKDNIPLLYSGEAVDVLLTIQRVMDFVTTRDYSSVEPIFYPNGGTARLRPDGMLWSSQEELLKSIQDMPMKVEEYMLSGAEVRIAGNLAMVWTQCKIYLDDNLASEATNCIALHKETDIWKLSMIADTATNNLNLHMEES